MVASARCVHREIKENLKTSNVSCAEPSSVSTVSQCLRRCDLFGQAGNWRGGLWHLRCNLRPIQISAGYDPPSRWRFWPDMKPAKSLQRNAQVAPNSLGSPSLLAAIDSIWRARFFVRNVLARHRGLRHLVLAISVEPLGQQIVDRHVVARDFKRKPLHRRRQAAARA